MGFLNTVLRVFPSPRDCFSYIQEVSLELCLDIPSAWIGHGAQQHPAPNISTLICHFRVLSSSLSSNQECAAPHHSTSLPIPGPIPLPSRETTFRTASTLVTPSWHPQ